VIDAGCVQLPPARGKGLVQLDRSAQRAQKHRGGGGLGRRMGGIETGDAEGREELRHGAAECSRHRVVRPVVAPEPGGGPVARLGNGERLLERVESR
jgi:hypothetical protein